MMVSSPFPFRSIATNENRLAGTTDRAEVREDRAAKDLPPPQNRSDPNNVINTVVKLVGTIAKDDDDVLSRQRAGSLTGIKRQERVINMDISEGLLSTSSDKSSSSGRSDRQSRRESMKKNEKIIQV
jgi:hypothetical protein